MSKSEIKRITTQASQSAPEALFTLQCRAIRLMPVMEYRFHQDRRWRFDFAWPEQMVAVEVEGAVWIHGRHSRGTGMQADMEKYNSAVLMGWRVFRFSPAMVKSGEAINVTRMALLSSDDNEVKNV